MKNVLEAVARQILAEAVLDGRVTGGAVVHGMGLSVAVVLAADADTLTPCQRDVLALLRTATERWTTSRVLRELDRVGLIWSESAVKEGLSRMVKRGFLRSNRRRPRGYEVVRPDGKAVADAA